MKKTTVFSVSRLWGGLSVSVKFLLPMFIGMLVLFAVSSWITIKQQEESLTKLLETSQHITERNNESLSVEAKLGEHKKAEIIAQLLAVIMPNLIAEFDMEAMNDYTSVIGKDPSISYVEIKNLDDMVLSKFGERNDIIEGQLVAKKIFFEGDELGEVIVSYNLSRFESYMKVLSEREKIDILELTNQQQASLDSAKIAMIFISLTFVFVMLSLLWGMFKIFVLNRLNALRVRMKDIAKGEGDLTKRMVIKGRDEIDKVGIHYNHFLETIHETVKQVRDSTSSLEGAAQHLLEITESMRSNVSGQQQEIELVATAVYEMSMSVQEVASNASKAASSADEADKSSKEGQNVVSSTVSIIETLSDEVANSANVIDKVKADSQKIDAILDVIKEIANQTNLLALNAAIEAARAGETGRGFAVVADEVRALASRTQQSTVEIQNMIEQLQSGTENAVKAMDAGKCKVKESVESVALAGSSFESIAGFISQVSDMNNQISCAADEQSNVAEDVNKSITRIKDVGIKTAESTEHTAEASQKLTSLSSELKQLVGKFKL